MVNEASKPWFCYVVRCREGSLYVGIAADLEERVREHNWGVGAAFTAKRRPVALVWFELFASHEEARKRVGAIKRWSRTKKLQLIAEFQGKVLPASGSSKAMAARA